MEYKIIGADGKEYGPVSLTQMQSWVKEGRINGSTRVLRSDTATWSTAANFSELDVSNAATTVSTPPPLGLNPFPADAITALLRQRIKSGASWLYWIAALSLINTVAAFSGTSWRFIFGLGITQIFDAIGHNIGPSGKLVAAVLDIAVVGVFCVLGVFAHKKQNWAFIVGMVLFGLDGLIYVLNQSWLETGIHALVLFWIFRGLQANRELKKIEAGLAG